MRTQGQRGGRNIPLTAECFVQAHNNIKLLLEQVVQQQPEPPELGLHHLPLLPSHRNQQSFIHYLSHEKGKQGWHRKTARSVQETQLKQLKLSLMALQDPFANYTYLAQFGSQLYREYFERFPWTFIGPKLNNMPGLEIRFPREKPI